MRLILCLAVVLFSASAFAGLHTDNTEVANKVCGEVAIEKALTRPDKPGTPIDDIGDPETDMVKQELGADCYAGFQEFKAKPKNKSVELAYYYEGGGSVIICGMGSCWVTTAY